MSSTTTTTSPVPPFQQWQQFFPAGAAYPYGGVDTNLTTIQDQIYSTVAGNAERTKQQAANDIARDILRAVDHGSAANLSTTERTSANIATAVERNGATNSHITELTASQLATAIERNGSNGMSTTERVNSQLASAVERNGANNMAAIERTTGEGRLTTVISDAASRQASSDATRDVLRTVDRVGADAVGSTKDSFATLLSTIERTSGESRLNAAIASGATDAAMRDVRYSILGDVNRVGTDLHATSIQNYNALAKAVTDSAWEQRTAAATGFQNISEENLRTKFELATKSADHYASMLLEQQKLGQFMASKADNHFAVNQLEMQKVKEGLATQAANHFAMNQLEQQKSFAASQLEAQKNREAIQKDLCDAKYEALKSQQYLTDKMGECCCTIKEKMDTLDRDRLRDNLNVSRDRNNILEGIELAQVLSPGHRYGGEYGYGRGYGRDRSPGRDRR